MATDKVHLSHCILCEFQQEVLQKRKNLLKKFGKGKVSYKTRRRWYQKFETGDLDLFHKPRSG